MNEKKPLAVILHVRVPDVLRGCDQQRYLERKLQTFGLRLRPPPTLIGTDHVVGYGLRRTGMSGWSVIETRGEVDAGVTLLDLQQHELVEDAMDAAAEDARRAKSAAEWAELCRLVPGFADEADDEDITAGSSFSPAGTKALHVAAILLAPLAWAHTGIRRIRCWYVREHG